MTSNLLQPVRQIKITGKPYTLDGRFETLRSIQQAFDKDIFAVYLDISGMGMDDVVKLAMASLNEKPDENTLGNEILSNIGFDEMKKTLFEWLTLALTPERDREKKLKAVHDLLNPKGKK